MTSITSSMPAAIGAALLLVACTEPQGTATTAAKPSATQNRTSRAAEYRAGLDAYVANRRVSALEHFRAAAEMGNVDAQYFTGVMYSNGEGTKRDYREAAKWYERAAMHDHPDALLGLARLYATGSGVNMDAHKAMELFGRAAQAYPPGEKRDQALQQKDALAAVLASLQKPAETTTR